MTTGGAGVQGSSNCNQQVAFYDDNISRMSRYYCSNIPMFQIVSNSKSAKVLVHFIYLHDRSSHGGGAYHHCYYTSQQQFAPDYVMSQAGLNSSNMVVGNGHEVALCTASGCRQNSHNTSQMAPGGVAGTVDHVHNNSQNQARTIGLLFN